MAEMQEAPRQTRFQRLFGFLTLPQFHRSAKGDALVEMPPRGISTDALEFAETALKGIPIAGARVEISAVLNIIKGFSIVSPLVPYGLTLSSRNSFGFPWHSVGSRTERKKFGSA
jgi:hypothetical protein